MDSKFLHNKMIEEILKREANNLAKVVSQIISIGEPNIEIVLRDLEDSAHKRYVGNKEELLDIISNGKKLKIIRENKGTLSVNTQKFDTGNRDVFVDQIYEAMIASAVKTQF